jgi:hypothetical protein
MEKIILHTSRFDLTFEGNTAIVDISGLIEELSKDYELLDRNPIVSVQGNYQYVTLKLLKKNSEKRTIGFK